MKKKAFEGAITVLRRNIIGAETEHEKSIRAAIAFLEAGQKVDQRLAMGAVFYWPRSNFPTEKGMAKCRKSLEALLAVLPKED